MGIHNLLCLVSPEPSRLATYFGMFMLHQEACYHTTETLTLSHHLRVAGWGEQTNPMGQEFLLPHLTLPCDWL